MLESLKFKKPLSELTKLPNIAEEMDGEDLRLIGLHCLEGFKADKQSRAEWEEAYAKAMKLALQIMEEKTFPWPKCSNIKFPLLTVAAINFHAKAYPTLISGSEVVTYRVMGKDDDGKKALRAKRVQDHQNFMLLEESDWEEQTDKALLVTPIMGCCFKKTFSDPEKRCTRSKLVLPQDLVVPYYTADLESTSRISEMFSLAKNAFLSRVRRGTFLDIEYAASYMAAPTDPMQAAKEDAQRVHPNAAAGDIPTELVEQHCLLDLDGDEYAEPYVVTFVRETGQVCRIVARFSIKDVEKNKKGEISYITPQHFYTKIPFIPSPDGGFYDLGFGMLLGPLNHSCDSLINQLIDAGTMEILGGGFMGRGVKIKRGENTFAPYEWKSVEAPGVSLKDNIVPLPTRSPSNVLLELLQFLVGYAERISSANEVQMGELPGSQQKTGAMEIANANGIKIFAAIYKRIWRALKQEFVKIYTTTALSGFIGRSYRSGDNWLELDEEDYALPPEGIWPCADPNIASKELMIKQCAYVVQMTKEIGGQDTYKAVIRLYKAMDVPRPEEIFPDPKGKDAIQAQPSPDFLQAQAKLQAVQLKGIEIQHSHVLAVADLLRKVEETQANIARLQAEARKLDAEAQGVAVGHNIALIQSKIAAEKVHSEHLIKVLDTLLQGSLNGKGADSGNAGGSSVPAMAGSGGDQELLSVLEGPTGANQGGMGQG